MDRLTLLGALGSALGTLLTLLLLRWLLFRLLRKWAERTDSLMDDAVLRATGLPSFVWVVALSANAALEWLPLEMEVHTWIERFLMATVALSLTLVIANVAAGVMGVAMRRGEAKVSSLSQAFVWVTILGLGLLWVFNTLGVQVTPLLTALGVGGLAVALALQDTLTNFFSGIHLLLERPFLVGHFIRLEEGREGYVMDVGWRTTRIKTLLEEVVIIPNSRIASSVVVNFDLPHPHLRLDLPISVAYDSDMEKVARVLQEVGNQAAKELPIFTGARPAETFLQNLGQWSADWILRIELRTYGDLMPARHALHTRILAAFAREGIRIPYPIQVVELKGK